MSEKFKIADPLQVYLKHAQEYGGHIKEILANVNDQQEQLKNLLLPFMETQNSLLNALEPIFQYQKGWRETIHAMGLPNYAHSPLLEQVVGVPETFQKDLETLGKQLHRSFQDLAPQTREVLLLLGAHGWYLDLEIYVPDLWELKQALSEGNIVEAEAALTDYFTCRIDEIEESVIERFSKREKLIRAAFNAHRREEYELSIPVLLAQSDGMCKEVMNQHLFMKRDKKPRTAIYVEQVAVDSFSRALLAPLAQTLPIGASENERGEGFNELNRHMVLHGESLDYGTKVNSLKAISLINYVAHVL